MIWRHPYCANSAISETTIGRLTGASQEMVMFCFPLEILLRRFFNSNDVSEAKWMEIILIAMTQKMITPLISMARKDDSLLQKSTTRKTPIAAAAPSHALRLTVRISATVVAAAMTP